MYAHAHVAKLADAPDLGSGGQPWGFESLHAHHWERKTGYPVFSFIEAFVYFRNRIMVIGSIQQNVQFTEYFGIGIVYPYRQPGCP